MTLEYIGIGMYSISFELEKAWQELFLLAGKLNPELKLPDNFLNSVSSQDILSNQNRLSHICGLPLISQFQKKMAPLCTPHFDLDEFEGPNYFSYCVVSKLSQVNSIEETKGMVAAINSHDSNSGAYVFRSEIEDSRKLGLFDNFYKKIVMTGSHKNSIQSLNSQEVDIASIDAASYYYLKRMSPEASNKLRIIGRSMTLPAPPFVTHKDNPLCSSSELIEALNKALSLLDQDSKDIIKIRMFSFVPITEYQLQLEQSF